MHRENSSCAFNAGFSLCAGYKVRRLMWNEDSKDEHICLFDPWLYEMAIPVLGPEQMYHGCMMHSAEMVHTYSAVANAF